MWTPQAIPDNRYSNLTELMSHYLQTPKSIANKQTGLGVTYSRVKQVRDYFLDKTYRKESGRSMFYEVSTEVMEEVEEPAGRVERRGFSDDHDPISGLQYRSFPRIPAAPSRRD